MAQITTALIQELRMKTNAGMMDCKKALEASNGNMEEAIDVLRKKGIAKAATRSDREAKEGVIRIKLNATKTEAYMLQLTSETDFVSRNDKFHALADELIELLSQAKTSSLDDFLKEKTKSTKTVQDLVDEFSGVIGEKINLAKVVTTKATDKDLIGSYIHSNNKIGVVLVLENGKGQDELGKDLCMHIAASKPTCINVNEIPMDDLAREKDILKTQAINEGKPEAMAEKIVEGKIRKYYEEVCLLEQNFVKDPSVKIKDLVATTGKGSSIASFVRFNIG